MHGEEAKEKDRVITVRFPTALANHCKEMAKQQHRSLTAQILHVVEEWVAWREEQGARPDVVPPSSEEEKACPTNS
jgi:hypothetical protein